MDAAADERVQRRSLHDEVIVRLRRAIMEGRLASGQRLNERVLCAQYGVSRTPLREAFKVLANEGLIEIHPNRGAMVTPLTLAELDSVIEVMAHLEQLIGRLAAERIDRFRIDTIKTIHQEMMECHARGDLDGYFKINQEIHRLLAEATGNEILYNIYLSLNDRVRRFRYQANLSPERWQQALRDHDQIIALIDARNGETLGNLLQTHLIKKIEVVRHGLANARTR